MFEALKCIRGTLGLWSVFQLGRSPQTLTDWVSGRHCTHTLGYASLVLLLGLFLPLCNTVHGGLHVILQLLPCYHSVLYVCCHTDTSRRDQWVRNQVVQAQSFLLRLFHLPLPGRCISESQGTLNKVVFNMLLASIPLCSVLLPKTQTGGPEFPLRDQNVAQD